jgi:hypothetical protein
MPRRSWLYGFAFALALAASVRTVAAQPEPPGQLTIVPTSGAGGTTITVTGTGCAPPSEVDVFLFDEGAQRNLDRRMVTPDDDGTWTAGLVLPPGLRPAGRILVGATCGEDAEYRVQVFTLTAPASPAQPTPRAPAFTG